MNQELKYKILKDSYSKFSIGSTEMLFGIIFALIVEFSYLRGFNLVGIISLVMLVLWILAIFIYLVGNTKKWKEEEYKWRLKLLEVKNEKD